MAYSANQYNYATPLSSSNLLVGKTFTGAQMLDFDAWLENVASVGVTRGTYTVDTLGKIISITATENDAFTPYLASDGFRIAAKPNTKYTLSFRRSGSPGRVFLFDSGETTNMVQSDANATAAALTLTTSATTTFITFRVGSNTPGGTSVYSEIMLNEGDAALHYEEYNSLQAYPGNTKFFTLHDNKLDGSYYPVSGDAGLWGTTLSDASGNLTTPFVVSNTDWLTVNAFRFISDIDCYPVSFTVNFYSNSTLVYTITETANTKPEYVHYLPSSVYVSGIVVNVTKVSKANAVARLYNIYNLPYVKRTDTLNTKTSENTVLTLPLYFSRTDTLKVTQAQSRELLVNTGSADTLSTYIAELNKGVINTVAASDTVKPKTSGTTTVHNIFDKRLDTLSIKQSNGSHILNTIDVTSDTLLPKIREARTSIHNTIDVTYDTVKVKHEDNSTLTNVHSKMKEPYREIYGKVYITYTDVMLDNVVNVVASSEAYNSTKEQTTSSFTEADVKFFTLYENDLTGNYIVSNANDYVGWSSAELSDNSGAFNTPQTLELTFFSRPIVDFSVTFDKDNIARNFTVTFTDSNGETTVYTYTDNVEPTVNIIDSTSTLADIVSIKFSITKTTKANAPATILNAPTSSTILYRGYDDVSELMSIDLLEELTYEDDIEALGGVSANEITVVLDNSNKDFFFNSNSPVSKQLKRNRKIVPWLGVEVVPGEIEWYTLGTFWSYKWDVPANGLTTTVVGFDTIGLLSLTTYFNHQTQVNKTIGELLEYVLEDAKASVPFLEYVIDDSLYSVVIPYAWFEYSNHAAALRKISQCYPMHIYCDRQGRVIAAPQKLQLDYYYDTWSDNTNVINKQYSSLYTALPNTINVHVLTPSLKTNEQLVNDEIPFLVSDGRHRNLTFGTERSLSFSAPYVSDIEVEVDCDDTLTYTYEVYSWGITISFEGAGEVRSITCYGTCVDTSTKSVVTKRNTERAMLDGTVTRDVSSDFIQTAMLANTIIDRLFNLSENDKYDAEVEYRGDISLTINDPILLQDGIAPDNRYNIKRHQLNWSGYLTGSADLNT